MEVTRPYKLSISAPTEVSTEKDIVEIRLSSSEVKAVMVVLGTAPSMMLDAGKGTEVREALDVLARLVR